MIGFFAMLLPAFCAASSSDWNFSTNGLRIHAGALGVGDVEQRAVLDLAVEDRLRDGRVVDFGVAVTAETDEVDDDVGAELVAVLERHAADAHHGVGIFAVDVEDGNRQALREVGRRSGWNRRRWDWW